MIFTNVKSVNHLTNGHLNKNDKEGVYIFIPCINIGATDGGQSVEASRCDHQKNTNLNTLFLSGIFLIILFQLLIFQFQILSRNY